MQLLADCMVTLTQISTETLVSLTSILETQIQPQIQPQ